MEEEMNNATVSRLDCINEYKKTEPAPVTYNDLTQIRSFTPKCFGSAELLSACSMCDHELMCWRKKEEIQNKQKERKTDMSYVGAFH